MLWVPILPTGAKRILPIHNLVSLHQSCGSLFKPNQSGTPFSQETNNPIQATKCPQPNSQTAKPSQTNQCRHTHTYTHQDLNKQRTPLVVRVFLPIQTTPCCVQGRSAPKLRITNYNCNNKRVFGSSWQGLRKNLPTWVCPSREPTKWVFSLI